MKNSKEKKLLNIIKYTPTLILLLTIILITIILYNEHLNTLEKTKTENRKTFIEYKKRFIKEHVYRTYNRLDDSNKRIEKDVNKLLKQYVNNAHKIALTIYENYKDSKTKEEIINIISTSLKNIRFQDGNSYLIIMKLTGETVVHPTAKIGFNVFSFEDENIINLYNKIFKELSSKDSYFTSWKWKKIGGEEKVEKVGYFKLFKPYNWTIGTGIYLDDVKKSIQKRLVKDISKIRFDENRGYIALYDLKSEKILTHINKENLGKDVRKIVKVSPEIEKKFENTIRKGEGYITYSSKESDKRTIFIKVFKPWGYTLNALFRHEDIEKQINENEKLLEKEFSNSINTLFLTSFILTLVLLVVSVFISKIVESIFLAYKKQLRDENEESLKQKFEKETQYNDLFVKNKMVQLLIDPKTLKILDANKSAFDFYGYSEEEFRNLTINDLNILPIEDIKKEVEKAISMREDFFLFKHKMKSGEVKSVKVYSVPSTFKNQNVLYSTIEDITSELIIKEALQRSKQIYENMFKLANIGMVVTTPDLKFVDVNNKFIEMIGYTKEELLNLSALDITYKKDVEKSIANYNQLLKNKKDSFILEKKYIRKDGTTFDALLTSKMITNENADNEYSVATVADITDLKRKDTILLQQSKMAAMGDMLSNIAHQWRQPLSEISSLSSGSKIQAQLGLLEQKELLENFDKIIDVTNHLSHTIEDFRTFFEPNRDREKFYTDEMFDKAIKLVDAKFKNSGIEVVKEIEKIELDSFMNDLIQVIINILVNAFDILNKAQNEKFIFVNIYKEDEKTIIDIKDSGGGVDSSIIHRVFEPYFTTKHQFSGTGIGLYMCEEIVHRHLNGSISVKNEEFTHKGQTFKGACFKIEL